MNKTVRSKHLCPHEAFVLFYEGSTLTCVVLEGKCYGEKGSREGSWEWCGESKRALGRVAAGKAHWEGDMGAKT